MATKSLLQQLEKNGKADLRCAAETLHLGLKADFRCATRKGLLWGYGSQLDVTERNLANVEANKVRRAYVQGERWEERVKQANWWARFLDEVRAG